ncbi:cation transporter [Paenibacillus motobuensis]|uniref:cation diffusion facilitator family transporter n=1 Tax=Paenibacillus TaxID=44249 RepID=UPI00203A459E|nr:MULTISPECIES: cation transporter [Paenibacillus]MCM3042178.1 cation transporter [Paenibacillus lutimineralis]MCM3649282.1 cation transporter [Paenibacillus motobuensis]
MRREQTAAVDSIAAVSMASNFALTALKGIVGIMFNSYAMLADALFSLAEILTTVSSSLTDAWRRFYEHKSPLSRQDPAQKAKSFLPIAVFMAVLILLGAMQTMITTVTAIFEGDILAPGYVAGVVVVVSLVVKELIFQIQYRSSSARAEKEREAYVENHRYSLYCSIIVMLGVFGAMAGHALDIQMMLYFDPIMAIVVAILVAYRAYIMVRKVINSTLATTLFREDTERLIETVQRVHGIITVEDLSAQEQGHYVRVIAKISVNPQITVTEANDIANRAKVLLMHRFSHVNDVSILVLPYDPGYPYKSNQLGANDDMPNLLQ